MKIRQGFVSNSSSSSFVCMVSGHSEGGYDMSLEEAGFCECENGHYFCDDYIVGEPKKEDNGWGSWRGELPSQHCPICTMTHINDTTLLKYLVKVEKIDLEMIMNKLRGQFGSYGELMKTLNDKS